MIHSQQQSSFTRQSPIDRIECRYSIQEIRQFYARILAGKGKNFPLEDIAKHIHTTAGNADINYATKRVAIKFEEGW